MVITESTKIRPGTYAAAGPPTLEEALLTVRGSDIVLDMSGFELVGRNDRALPDQGRGIALLIDGGDNVTVRGATIRGYRFGIVARGVSNLVLYDLDLSYNWKPRLFSLIGHESLVDWMSFHNNEEREWMRWGAAIYLEDVTDGQVRQVRAEQGMNGLLMVRTDSLRVEDNTFAHNSALGIGMYRSSHNLIFRNRMDYNVRGYSHGYYNRGQDSAGILLYEQSSNNVIAYNSMTHGGDGLFLWAGQTTMDTGQGGANDNLIFHNDFNWAPTNSVEVTFSRNRVIGNYLIGSRYGVWGGYSWESEFVGNCFGLNETGIAIEHGQDNVIARNEFHGDQTAVQLWSRASEPEDWGYPRNRDTQSRNNRIIDNLFAGHDDVWRLDRTTDLTVEANTVRDEAGDPFACDPRELLGDDFERLAPDLPGPREIPVVERAALDRSAMIVDEWGPYDGRQPKLWPVDTMRTEVRLQLLGPEGTWRLVSSDGVQDLSARAGRTGDTLTVFPRDVGDWRVQMSYEGAETVHPVTGAVTPEGEAVPFHFERFEPATEWEVDFHTGTAEDIDFTGGPFLERTDSRLDYIGYGPLASGLPDANWGFEATGTVTLPEGEYSLRTISDDGIRVWVDGELVLDHWEPHGSVVDYAEIGPGTHDLRVQYRQVGGWFEARVEIVRGTERSYGSAGPG